eukprot:Skav210390  [mRNA]  locus=scaffold1526:386327:400103:+ [translate_table: standard]
MISAAEAKVEEPDLKKPRLDGGPPPPPPTPPPVPALKPNGTYGMQELISQMAARGVAKPPPGMALPPQMPLGMPAMGMRPGMMPQPIVNMPCQNCHMPLPPPPGGGPCGPCGPRVGGGCCGSCMLPLPGPPATGKPIFLAPATVASKAHIKVTSSKPGKQLAMDFVQSSKERLMPCQEKQVEMLKDPNVARAILQTLEGSGAGHMAVQCLGQGHGLSMGCPGVLTLARNSAKRLPARVSLHRGAGKVQDIETAVRSAAQHQPAMLDIKHRVPFDDFEAARRISSGSVLSVDPISPNDQKSFDEYIKYFKTKRLSWTCPRAPWARAGVARLDGNLALYLLPAGESPEAGG